MTSYRSSFGVWVSAAVWLAGGVSALAVPSILQAPQPITVTAGATANFAVSATGTGTLHFDWRRDGASLGAPDSANYALPATTLADSGAEFSVVVSDSSASTPSASAFLTVNPVAPNPFATWAAAISDPAQRGPTATPLDDGVPNLIKYTLGVAPGSLAVPGDLPVLAPTAGGSVLRFERSRSATGISTVVEKSTTLADGSWAGAVAVKVADDGAFETWEAAVSAADPRAFYRLNVTTNSDLEPTISTNPASVSVSAGGTPVFSVAATGTGPFIYQWRKNGSLITGATGASYTAPAVSAADNDARFTVLVTNPAGTVASIEAVLTVSTAARVTTYTKRAALPSVDGGPNGVWSNLEPAILCDKVGGDLIGFFPGDTKLMAAVSPDRGRTWRVVSPSPSFGLPASGTICQSADGKVHVVYAAWGWAGVAYARFTLVRDANGHVTNFTSDLPMSEHGNFPELMLPDANGGARAGIVAGTDKVGNPRLFWVIYDAPNSGSVKGRIVAGMSSVAAGWAPTSSADWVSLGNTSGVTEVESITNDPGGYAGPHNSGVHLAQHPISKDIWFEWGPIDTGDGTSSNTFPVKRRRAVPNGNTSWTTGSAVVVDTFSTALTFECLIGGMVATPNYVWFQRCSPVTGVVIDKVDRDGVVTPNAIPSPWTGARGAPVCGFNVNSAETEAWFGGWISYDSWREPSVFFAMHWDGVNWTRFNDVDLGDAWGVAQSGAWDNGLVLIVPDASSYHVSLATIRTE